MEPVILKVLSQDATFLDFYSRLAHELGREGTVYTPYPVIPPNARMGVPPPTEVLVALPSADSFAAVCETARVYLGGHGERRLVMETRRGSALLDAKNPPDDETLTRQLFAATDR